MKYKFSMNIVVRDEAGNVVFNLDPASSEKLPGKHAEEYQADMGNMIVKAAMAYSRYSEQHYMDVELYRPPQPTIRCNPGEPYFVLLGRDPQAPELVMQWAAEREICEPEAKAKTDEAFQIATAMMAYKEQHPDIGMPAGQYAKYEALRSEAAGRLEPVKARYQYWKKSKFTWEDFSNVIEKLREPAIANEAPPQVSQSFVVSSSEIGTYTFEKSEETPTLEAAAKMITDAVKERVLKEPLVLETITRWPTGVTHPTNMPMEKGKLTELVKEGKWLVDFVFVNVCAEDGSRIVKAMLYMNDPDWRVLRDLGKNMFDVRLNDGSAMANKPAVINSAPRVTRLGTYDTSVNIGDGVNIGDNVNAEGKPVANNSLPPFGKFGITDGYFVKMDFHDDEQGNERTIRSLSSGIGTVSELGLHPVVDEAEDIKVEVRGTSDSGGKYGVVVSALTNFTTIDEWLQKNLKHSIRFEVSTTIPLPTDAKELISVFGALKAFDETDNEVDSIETWVEEIHQHERKILGHFYSFIFGDVQNYVDSRDNLIQTPRMDLPSIVGADPETGLPIFGDANIEVFIDPKVGEIDSSLLEWREPKKTEVSITTKEPLLISLEIWGISKISGVFSFDVKVEIPCGHNGVDSWFLQHYKELGPDGVTTFEYEVTSEDAVNNVDDLVMVPGSLFAVSNHDFDIDGCTEIFISSIKSNATTLLPVVTFNAWMRLETCTQPKEAVRLVRPDDASIAEPYLIIDVPIAASPSGNASTELGKTLLADFEKKDET
jgi:hypothetical protein